MTAGQCQIIKVCSRSGFEYFHVQPRKPFRCPPRRWRGLKVKIFTPKYCVVAFADCEVLVFPTGRMLIENLPVGSEDRVKAIVKKIRSGWR